MKAADIQGITKSVTKKWTAQRKREERTARTRFYRHEYMYSDRVNQSDVADEVIPKAYAKASDNGRLPAHARQIFYAARGEIQERTGRPLDSVYFTQTLLPKFVNRNPETTADWWVVYDARGHLTEPHTDTQIPLGTLDVDEYLRNVRGHKVTPPRPSGLEMQYPTKGPANRLSAILFIEKEGFNPLFKEVKLAQRYDIAIMSTKGQSVVAARRLIDELCHGDGIPVLVLHDFDKQGFEIAQNLTQVSNAALLADRVRYEFQNDDIQVIDLGLRLEDVQKWNLESESVRFKGSFESGTIATPEEQKFLRSNRRVELNAFTSADFVTWIEEKLRKHRIKKVVPDSETLTQAYRRAFQIAHVNRSLGRANKEARRAARKAPVPRGLRRKILGQLKEFPEKPWDAVVADIAESQVAGDHN